MKKLTLNKAWQLCLKQWEWIIRELDNGSKANIGTLKYKWCFDNKLSPNCYCFFCEYSSQNGLVGQAYCHFCPAKLINKNFSCTTNEEYHYAYEPRAFYAKLLKLNKKRLKKK